jgi:hypothetical protein
VRIVWRLHGVRCHKAAVGYWARKGTHGVEELAEFHVGHRLLHDLSDDARTVTTSATRLPSTIITYAKTERVQARMTARPSSIDLGVLPHRPPKLFPLQLARVVAVVLPEQRAPVLCEGRWSTRDQPCGEVR